MTAGDDAPVVVGIGVDGEIDVEAWAAVPITVACATGVAAPDVLLCAADTGAVAVAASDEESPGWSHAATDAATHTATHMAITRDLIR